MATSRAVLMTIGQLSFYDQVKQMLIATNVFSDNLLTHFLSSLTAVSFNHRNVLQHNICRITDSDFSSSSVSCIFLIGVQIFLQGAVATSLTQPLDVLKTRAMNAKPGEFSVSLIFELVLQIESYFSC